MPAQITDWNLLRCMLEVARAGSFLAARERLNASQPTVGRKVDELERQLGAKIFIRTAHGISLTEAGRRILAIAEKMETLSQSVSVEATGENRLTGAIRFKVTDGIGGYWIPLMLERFIAENPYITVDVSICDDNTMPDLSRREADITVVYREPTDPDVCVLAVDEAIGAPLVSQIYADKYGLPTTFDELLDHPFCAHEMHLRTVGPWAPLARVLQKHQKIVYRSSSSLAVCQAVRRGLGITYMPIGVMDREPDALFFDIEGFTARVPFWLVCHKDVKDIPSVRAMVNYIKAALFRGLNGSLSRRQNVDVVDIETIGRNMRQSGG
ncbi:MAG TPA: LysR family transcriptional regulator [Candidatus Sulfotelmatobacter sp.]|nr:LysR family transcriptional regulator [Candidatus Sulfotelmatobacter sp.]